MMKAINNIQYLRIGLYKELNMYYLPYSTGFQNKKIKHIILYDPLSDDMVDVSGIKVFSLKNTPMVGLFLNLKNDDDSELVRDVDISLLDSGNKDIFIPIGKDVKWENSYLRTRGVLPDENKVMLMYVVYDDLREISGRYTVVKQVNVPAADGMKKLSSYIDASKYGYLKKIEVISRKKLTGKNFITLNCRSGRTFNTVPLEFFQSDHGMPKLKNAIAIADYNVDWNNSTIINTDNDVFLNLYFGK